MRTSIDVFAKARDHERLEQLRALENGISILVVETASKSQSISVDTAADLERVRAALLATSAQRINA